MSDRVDEGYNFTEWQEPGEVDLVENRSQAKLQMDASRLDLVYMLKKCINNGYDFSFFAGIDVFRKKAKMIPLKDREQTITTKTHKKLNKVGVPKSVYSDSGLRT